MIELKSKMGTLVNMLGAILGHIKIFPFLLAMSSYLIFPTPMNAKTTFGVECTDVVGFSLSMPLSRKSFTEFNLGWKNLHKNKSLLHSGYYLLNEHPDLINNKSEKMEIYYGGGYKLVIKEKKLENPEDSEKKEISESFYLRAQAGIRYRNKLFELFFSILPGIKLIPELSLDLSVTLGIRYYLP
ncbi:MAG: hypothetical protein AB8G05_03360 [Oligoflexales bacterium]